MSAPKFSIVVPTLNRLVLLKETLDSFRNQTFPHWEAFIVDDGSTDGTDDYVTHLSQMDSRIHYIQRSGPTSGAPACRNLGTRLSQADYLIYVDSDDCLAPNALEQRFQFMEALPELDFSLSPCIGFRETFADMSVYLTVDTGIDPIDRFLNFDVPWQTMAPTWRRDSLLALGAWDEDLLCFQDNDLHLRALTQGYRYAYLPQPDCFWRISREDTVSAQGTAPSRMRSHAKFFGQVQTYLTQADLFTPQRLDLIGGLYFWLIDFWAFQGHQPEAIALWQLAFERGLFNRLQFLEGRIYIYLSGLFWLPLVVRRTLRRVMREYFRLTWRRKLLPTWAETPLKVPVPPEQLAALNLNPTSPISYEGTVT
jgi:glycosyltransferase involved in cell wall biosynthesis